jgi:hypothetical protein
VLKSNALRPSGESLVEYRGQISFAGHRAESVSVLMPFFLAGSNFLPTLGLPARLRRVAGHEQLLQLFDRRRPILVRALGQLLDPLPRLLAGAQRVGLGLPAERLHALDDWIGRRPRPGSPLGGG